MDWLESESCNCRSVTKVKSGLEPKPEPWTENSGHASTYMGCAMSCCCKQKEEDVAAPTKSYECDTDESIRRDLSSRLMEDAYEWDEPPEYEPEATPAISGEMQHITFSVLWPHIMETMPKVSFPYYLPRLVHDELVIVWNSSLRKESASMHDTRTTFGERLEELVSAIKDYVRHTKDRSNRLNHEVDTIELVSVWFMPTGKGQCRSCEWNSMCNITMGEYTDCEVLRASNMPNANELRIDFKFDVNNE